MTKLTKFDAAEYLDSEEVIAEYLNAALEDEDPNVFLAAIGDIAKARGMTELAKDVNGEVKARLSGEQGRGH